MVKGQESTVTGWNRSSEFVFIDRKDWYLIRYTKYYYATSPIIIQDLKNVKKDLDFD